MNRSKSSSGESESAARKELMRKLGPAIFLIVGEGAALIMSRPSLAAAALKSGKKATVELNATMARGALAEFLLNPILGRLSDRYGRKGFLVMITGALALSRASVYLRPRSITTIRTDRIASMALVTSFFSLVRAMQHDVIHDRKSAAQAAAQIAKWAGLGVVVGPIVGQLSANLAGTRGTFLASAFMAAASCFLFSQLKETLKEDEQKPVEIGALNPFSFKKMLDMGSFTRTLMLVSLLQTFGDPRNVQESTAAFMRLHLKWSRKQMNTMVSVNGVTGIAGAFIARSLIKKLGVSLFTTFSNACNALGPLIFGLAPNRAPLDALFLYTSLIVGVGGQRKRDGVESTIIRHCQSKGMGKGEASASLANWRSIASIAAPLLFGKAYQIAGVRAPFLTISMLSVAAEGIFRTVNLAAERKQ